MNTYIWAYSAKIVGTNGTITGRIEATTGFDAKQAVVQNNLMVDSVEVRLVKNQNQARNEKYEVYPCAV